MKNTAYNFILIFLLNTVFITVSYAQGAWTSQTSGTSSNLFGVYFLNDSTGWVLSNSGEILKTVNGGVTWHAQTSGTSNVLRSIDFINDTKPLFSGIVFFTLITLSTALAQVPGKEKIS